VPKKQDFKKPDTRTLFFIEEFSWLLKTYSDINLYDELNSLVNFLEPKMNLESVLPSSNPNITYLAGTLPRLFMNKDYFPQNEDIAKFAKKVLHVSISRYDKRSQYELIGLIVCQVTNMNDKELNKIVKELNRHIETIDNPKIGDLNKQLSWNQVIQKLSGENIDDEN